MAACRALGILGIFSGKAVYAGRSDPAAVLFAGLFIIGAAMFHTRLAQGNGAEPQSIVRALGIAASAAFCTPAAIPPDTPVLGPGKDFPNDYVKFGFPLLIIALVTGVIILPTVWPFFLSEQAGQRQNDMPVRYRRFLPDENCLYRGNLVSPSG